MTSQVILLSLEEKEVTLAGKYVELCMLCCTMTFTGFTMLHGLELMFSQMFFLFPVFWMI